MPGLPTTAMGPPDPEWESTQVISTTTAGKIYLLRTSIARSFPFIATATTDLYRRIRTVRYQYGHAHVQWLGLRFFDFDQDGALDLIVCNGHLDDLIEMLSTTLTYKEPILLFHRTSASSSRIWVLPGRKAVR